MRHKHFKELNVKVLENAFLLAVSALSAVRNTLTTPLHITKIWSHIENHPKQLMSLACCYLPTKYIIPMTRFFNKHFGKNADETLKLFHKPDKDIARYRNEENLPIFDNLKLFRLQYSLRCKCYNITEEMELVTLVEDVQTIVKQTFSLTKNTKQANKHIYDDNHFELIEAAWYMKNLHIEETFCIIDDSKPFRPYECVLYFTRLIVAGIHKTNEDEKKKQLITLIRDIYEFFISNLHQEGIELNSLEKVGFALCQYQLEKLDDNPPGVLDQLKKSYAAMKVYLDECVVYWRRENPPTYETIVPFVSKLTVIDPNETRPDAYSYTYWPFSIYKDIAVELIQSYIQVQDKENIQKVCTDVSHFFKNNLKEEWCEMAPDKIYDFYSRVMKIIPEAYELEIGRLAMKTLWCLAEENCRFGDHRSGLIFLYGAGILLEVLTKRKEEIPEVKNVCERLVSEIQSRPNFIDCIDCNGILIHFNVVFHPIAKIFEMGEFDTYFEVCDIFTPVMVALNDMLVEKYSLELDNNFDRVRKEIEEFDPSYNDDDGFYRSPFDIFEADFVLQQIITCLWSYVRAKKLDKALQFFSNMFVRRWDGGNSYAEKIRSIFEVIDLLAIYFIKYKVAAEVPEILKKTLPMIIYPQEDAERFLGIGFTLKILRLRGFLKNNKSTEPENCVDDNFDDELREYEYVCEHFNAYSFANKSNLYLRTRNEHEIADQIIYPRPNCTTKSIEFYQLVKRIDT